MLVASWKEFFEMNEDKNPSGSTIRTAAIAAFVSAVVAAIVVQLLN